MDPQRLQWHPETDQRSCFSAPPTVQNPMDSPPVFEIQNGTLGVTTMNSQALFQAQQHQAQMERLAAELTSMRVSPHHGQMSPFAMNNASLSSTPGSESSMELNRVNPGAFDQEQKRKDPVYASMATHVAASYVAPVCDVDFSNFRHHKNMMAHRCHMDWS